MVTEVYPANNSICTLSNGNRYEVGLLPVKHFFQFSALFQSLTGQSKVVEHLPVHFLGVDGSGILLLRQIIIKGHPNLCQLLLAFELLAVLQHGTQVIHALLHIVCQYLVQPEMSRIIELFEEVGHEVFQKSVLVVELQERCLIGSCCFSGLKVALVVDT